MKIFIPGIVVAYYVYVYKITVKKPTWQSMSFAFELLHSEDDNALASGQVIIALR